MNLQGSGVGALPPLVTALPQFHILKLYQIIFNVYHTFANLIQKQSLEQGKKRGVLVACNSFVKESRSSLLCKNLRVYARGDSVGGGPGDGVLRNGRASESELM